MPSPRDRAADRYASAALRSRPGRRAAFVLLIGLAGGAVVPEVAIAAPDSQPDRPSAAAASATAGSRSVPPATPGAPTAQGSQHSGRPGPALRVSYLSDGVVYLDGGRAEGLTVGARLEARRQGEAIALLEVAYLADHSASCRVLSETRAPAVGDQVILLTPTTRPPDEIVAAEPTAPPTAPVDTPEATTPVLPPIVRSTPTATPATRRPRLSGVFSLGTQQFTNSGDAGGGYGESTGRLSLRLRNLQGLPLDLRIRARGRQTDRDAGSTSSSERLYELSLSYAPDEGRFAWAVGRLGASPFVSIGYLDGALGQVRLGRRFFVGAFAGSRPEVRELGLGSAGSKYGAYLRFSTPSRQAGGKPALAGAANHDPGYAEVVLAGIGEYAAGGETSREFLALESRFGAGERWSLFQRAELEINRGWRQTASGSSNQISNASLAASFRFSPRLRGHLSYDQRRNYLTFETRPRPEEVFTRYLREGTRGSLEWELPSGWNTTVGAGNERDDSGGDATTSAWLSVWHANLFGSRLLAGVDLSTYRGGVADGYVATVRLRRTFARGHDVGLTLGASEATLADVAEARSNQWARLSATLQLPRRFYLFGELEVDTGDDLEGQRYILELGYQF